MLEKSCAVPWGWLRDRLYVDELYGVTVIAFYAWWARVADWLDRRVWGGAGGRGCVGSSRLWAQFNRFLDTNWVDGSFDKGCEELSSGGLLARVQRGRVQTYLRILALAVVALAAILIWSSRA